MTRTSKNRRQPFGSKGDHDNEGKTGGAATPLPTQEKADEIRAEQAEEAPASPASEPPPKAKNHPQTSGEPSPTQAELDAMRAGSFSAYKSR